MGNAILQVENLVKRYGDVEAVRGVSFSVEEGEVFGLLGPNGAGKTSTVEVLEGLRARDSGRVSVCGLDPQRDSQALKHEIGAALQSTALPDKLRVMEALRLFASFYRRRRNPEELLERFGLKEKRHAFYNQQLRWPWPWPSSTTRSFSFSTNRPPGLIPKSEEKSTTSSRN